MWLVKAYAIAKLVMICVIIASIFDRMETEWLLITGIVCLMILGLMALITVVIFFDDNDLGLVILGFSVFFLFLSLGLILFGIEINEEAVILPLLGGAGVVIWAVFSSLKSLFRGAY